MPYLEAIYSRTARLNDIDNTPNDEQLENMVYTSKHLFEPIFAAFHGLIIVTSFFRSHKLNQILRGAKNSQHTKGQALDMVTMKNPKYTNKDLFEFIKDNLEFDQLIWEKGTKDNPRWIHASIVNGKNRNQIIYNL